MAKSYGTLVPSIERRLSTWIELHRSGAMGPHERARPTITLSRQYGCQGFPLAEALKSILDEATGEEWNIYDKALLETVARNEQLAVELFADLGGPSRAIDAIGFIFPDHIPQDDLFRRIPRYIVGIACRGNAIVVGRGGAIITQKIENCFHFRLEARMEFRVATMAERLELSHKEAEKHVRTNERLREEFIRDCLQASVADTALYDAIYNNGRHGVREIARSIVAYVDEAWRLVRPLGAAVAR